jgi:hypothetical protein
MRHPAPPSGAAAPVRALVADGLVAELVPLAREICRRYRLEFPDEDERYGPAGQQWCVHDNQYLLAWAIQHVRDGTVDLSEQAVWLAGVLDARQFPVARLARGLEIAAAVAQESAALGPLRAACARALTHAATVVAQRGRS